MVDRESKERERERERGKLSNSFLYKIVFLKKDRNESKSSVFNSFILSRSIKLILQAN